MIQQPNRKVKDNPSWLAVSKLNGTTLALDTSTSSYEREKRGEIHFSAIEIPTTYSAVLETVPLLHERPPQLPHNLTIAGDPADRVEHPPEEGYDLILHCGVGYDGDIRIEQRAHKSGYSKSDMDGHLAPIIAESSREETKVQNLSLFDSSDVG